MFKKPKTINILLIINTFIFIYMYHMPMYITYAQTVKKKDVRYVSLEEAKKDEMYLLWIKPDKEYQINTSNIATDIKGEVYRIGQNREPVTKYSTIQGRFTNIFDGENNKVSYEITWNYNNFNNGIYISTGTYNKDFTITPTTIVSAFLQLVDESELEDNITGNSESTRIASNTNISNTGTAGLGNSDSTESPSFGSSTNIYTSPGIGGSSGSGGSNISSGGSGGSSGGSNISSGGSGGSSGGTNTGSTGTGSTTTTTSPVTETETLCTPTFDHDNNQVFINSRIGNNPCTQVSIVPMETSQLGCSIRVDLGLEEAIVTEKKRYTYNGQSNDITGCYDTNIVYELLKDKSDCQDGFNPENGGSIVTYNKYYYVNNNNKYYVSACLAQNTTMPVNSVDISTEVVGFDHIFDDKTSYKLLQDYTIIDGNKYYISDKYRGGSYSQILQKGECRSYDVNRNINPAVVYEQKQWGITTEDNVYHPVTPCASDRSIGYPTKLSESFCTVSVNVNAREYTLHKEETYTSSNGAIIVITPCFQTNDIHQILASDIDKDYNSCDDYIDITNLIVRPQYKEIFEKNGTKYEIAPCKRDTLPGATTWKINKTTLGCQPVVKYEEKKVYFKSQLSYTKNGNIISVTSCEIDISIETGDILEEARGCVNDITPDKQYYIYKTNKYYLDTNSNKVELQNCTNRLDNSTALIPNSDKQKDYDICTPGLTFAVVNGVQKIGTFDELNGKHLTPYYREYIVLGNNKTYLQEDCLPDSSTLPYTAVLEINNCSPVVIYNSGGGGSIPTYDSNTPVGIVKVRYDVSFVNSSGEKIVLINCLQPDDEYSIYQQFAGCDPIAVGNNTFIKTRKFYYSDAIGNRIYLTNSCELSNDERVAQETFCDDDPFHIDYGAGANLVYYNTKFTYNTFDNSTNTTTSEDLTKCSKSYNKAIVPISDKTCGYLHDDTTRTSELYAFRSYSYDNLPPKTQDTNGIEVDYYREEDKDDLFILNNLDASGITKMNQDPTFNNQPLGNLNSVKLTSAPGIDGTDDVSEFMKEYCSFTGTTYGYTPESKEITSANNKITYINFFFSPRANNHIKNGYNIFYNTTGFKPHNMSNQQHQQLIDEPINFLFESDYEGVHRVELTSTNNYSNSPTYRIGDTTIFLPSIAFIWDSLCLQKEYYNRINNYGGRVFINKQFNIKARISPTKKQIDIIRNSDIRMNYYNYNSNNSYNSYSYSFIDNVLVLLNKNFYQYMTKFAQSSSHLASSTKLINDQPNVNSCYGYIDYLNNFIVAFQRISPTSAGYKDINETPIQHGHVYDEETSNALVEIIEVNEEIIP